MSDFNLTLIRQRGGNLCGSDRFSIECCQYCQGQYLYNDELKDVYYDPQDLSRHFFKVDGMRLPPCRYCGALTWEFAEPPDQAIAQMGPWAWTLDYRRFYGGSDDSADIH